MKLFLTFAVLVALVLLTGCADLPALEITDPDAHVYGFWGGVWHGCIVVWNAIGALIWDDVTVYAPSNNGGFYSLGFLLGNIIFGGGIKLVFRS